MKQSLMTSRCHRAAKLRIRVANPRGCQDTARSRRSRVAGRRADEHPLNRTPRVYQTEPPFAGKIPRLEVRAVRAEGKLIVRLEWDDATKNAPEAPPRKTGDGGDPDKIYKRPTARNLGVRRRRRGHGSRKNGRDQAFPSLQMGDAKNPVRIFYWNASRGAEELAASGRTTPKATGRRSHHKAEHAANKWRLTLELPDQPDGMPMAFAMWDGGDGRPRRFEVLLDLVRSLIRGEATEEPSMTAVEPHTLANWRNPGLRRTAFCWRR